MRQIGHKPDQPANLKRPRRAERKVVMFDLISELVQEFGLTEEEAREYCKEYFGDDYNE